MATFCTPQTVVPNLVHFFTLPIFITFQPPGEHHNGLAGPSQALPCLTKPVDKPARPALARPTLCLWQAIQFSFTFPIFSLLAAWSEDLVFVLGRQRHGFGPKRLVFIRFSHHFHHFQGAELASQARACQARPGQAQPYVCWRLSNFFSLCHFFTLAQRAKKNQKELAILYHIHAKLTPFGTDTMNSFVPT